MRVLVFGASLDKRAGIESFLMNMNKHMDGNCTFDYVCLENRTNRINEPDFCRGDGTVIELPPYGKKPIKYLHGLSKLFQTGKNKYAAVYVNLFSMVHILPALLAKMYGYQVVLHAHNSNMPPRSRLYMFLHRLNRRLTSGMNFIRLTNSDGSAEFMFGKKHLSDATLIYNAIDTDRFGFNETFRKEIRAELGLGDRPTVGFVGRLTPDKNPLFVIEVFSEIHKFNPAVCLLMVGEGTLMDDVKKKIRDYGLDDAVILLPNRTDIEKIYCAMDSLILPSAFEGLGIVLIEAQCSGLPCVASADVIPAIVKVTELTEFVSLNESGKLWAEKCASAMDKKVNRTEYRDVLAQSRFNIEKEALALETVLCNRNV